MKLTAVIITRSEKVNKLLLESIDFADEIIILVDSPAKKTKREDKIHYLYHPLENDFASQRNYALKNAQGDWVLFVDDDEYVGNELAKEIQQQIEKTQNSGFLIKRIDVCFHQRLLHGETGYTRLLRLAKKSSGKFVRSVHEYWEISGKIGELVSPLYHTKDNFIESFIGRMIQYSDIDSSILTKENKPFSYWRLFLNPFGKFLQNYFLRLGLLDGTVGLFSAYLMSVQSLTVRIFQWTQRK